ncbi:MAG TPA: hypothetical protein VGF48_15590 [Thermoanaerobaculia bacterium]|jgi:hypothetical protein
MKTLVSLSALALVLVLAPTAFAQSDWTANATTGAIRPGSAPQAWFGPSLGFSGASLGTIVSRYNVTNTWGTAAGGPIPPWTWLRASIDDSTASGFVSVRLFEVRHCSNQAVLMCEIVSADVPGTQCPVCKLPYQLDFSTHEYYVEVTMNRNMNVPLTVTGLNLF